MVTAGPALGGGRKPLLTGGAMLASALASARGRSETDLTVKRSVSPAAMESGFRMSVSATLTGASSVPIWNVSDDSNPFRCRSKNFT